MGHSAAVPQSACGVRQTPVSWRWFGSWSACCALEQCRCCSRHWDASAFWSSCSGPIVAWWAQTCPSAIWLWTWTCHRESCHVWMTSSYRERAAGLASVAYPGSRGALASACVRENADARASGHAPVSSGGPANAAGPGK